MKFLPVFLAAIFLVSGCKQTRDSSEPPSRPNIVFILADDLGWADLPAYGNTFNEAPNIDKLAAEGVRFTNAYAA